MLWNAIIISGGFITIYRMNNLMENCSTDDLKARTDYRLNAFLHIINAVLQLIINLFNIVRQLFPVICFLS